MLAALALACLAQALPLQGADAPEPERRALVAEALALERAGELERALELLADALARGLAPDDELELRRAKVWLLGQAQRLEDTLREELVLLARLHALCEADDLRLLRARQDHVLTLFELARLDEAREEGERFLEDVRRLRPDDETLLLKALQNLGVVLSVSGEAGRARLLHEEVLALVERSLPAGHPEVLAAQGNLAQTLRTLGDHRAASALHGRVLAGMEQVLPSGHPFLVRAQHNHAVDLRIAGRLEEALAVLERCVEDGAAGARATDVVSLALRLDLGVSFSTLGRTEEARATFAELVLDLEDQAGGRHPLALRARIELAALELRLGDPAVVPALLAPLVDDPDVRASLEPRSLLACRALLVLAHLRTGEEEASRAAAARLAAEIEPLLLESGRLSPREARERARTLSPHLSLLLSEELVPREAVFRIVESARAAGSRVGLLGGEANVRAKELKRAAASARERIHDLVSRGGDDGAELAREIGRLVLERDRAEGELARILSKEHGTRAQEAEALSRALRPGEAAVGLHVATLWARTARGAAAASPRVIAFVLTPTGKLARIDLCATEELEDLVEAWYEALGVPLERGRAPESAANEQEVLAGERLRASILDPLLAACGEERPTRLWLCAAGPLIALPLDALPLEGGKARVGDRLTILPLVSFTSLLGPASPASAPAASAAGELVALGGVRYGEIRDGSDGARAAPSMSFAPLLQTRLEVEAVRALWPHAEHEPRLLLGERATKAALAASAPGARFLHVATHGWSDGRSIGHWSAAGGEAQGLEELRHATSWLAPLAWCGLALAGANAGADELGRTPGLLSAEELAGWDLSRCELAVLSACESGLGLLDGAWFLQSLRAALHAAGARSTLTSSWRVDDAATRRLMELFYGYLWSEDLPKAASLWRAKQDLAREGAPLRQWAGWILSGDPR